MLTRVLITAIGGGGFGDQVLKALLHLRKGTYEVFGADCNKICHQAKLVKKFFQLPMAQNRNYLKTILKICKNNKIKILIAGCESEMVKISNHETIFAKKNILVIGNSKKLIQLCRNKLKTSQVLLKNGFCPPKTMIIKNIVELQKVKTFPQIIKPLQDSGGSSNVYLAQTKKELTALFTYLRLSLKSTKFIMQEYLGSPEDEYTVGVLHNHNGEFINAIALRRYLHNRLSIKTKINNHSGKRELGNHLVISSGISQGRIGDYPEVVVQCKKIADSLESKGPLNIQCRFVNGLVRVFEINPRFSGTTSIRALAGVNEPDILIRSRLSKYKNPSHLKIQKKTILRGLTEFVTEKSLLK